jgi:hypothetical protein
MTKGTAGLSKVERIAQARAELARRIAADPAGHDRARARMAKLTAAAKRERERFETRCLGKKPPAPALPPKPKGMSRVQWKVEKVRLRAEAEAGQSLAAKWSHKEGTPETHEHASTTHQGALAQLHLNGVIDAEQLEWAAQIDNVHRSIEADVTVAVASLEARVDQSRRGTDVGEGVRRVRLHRAYTIWRDGLPSPKRLVLDMLVGEPIGYTVAARRYGVHNRRAKRLLIEAIDRWPDCVALAYRLVSPDDVDRLNAA